MAITNLYAKVAYTQGANKPICILMHGWDGDATSIASADMQRFARLGLFVVAVGMRGRNSASGANDASAREIHDIYDVLAYVRTNYAAYVSTDKAAIIGYSGGGGNALAAACKFPDAWTVIASFFGISDYGRDGTDGWYANNGGTYTASIVTAVGDTPANTPNNYYARDATAAIANFTGGYLYLYHDKQDTTVPWVHGNRIKATLDAAGMTNYSANFSDTGEFPRFTHGYPTADPSKQSVESALAADMIGRAAWTVPASGTVTVIGYIVTKRFTIWLNANGTATLGIDAAATVVYDTVTDTYTVTPLTGAIDVTITQGAKTGSATNITTETEIVVA